MKTACTSRLRFLNSPILVGFARYAAGLVLTLVLVSSAAAGETVAAESSQSAPAQATGGTWTATGNLHSAPRADHTATLLPDGQLRRCTLVSYGDVATEWTGAGGWRPSRESTESWREPDERSTIRSGDWNVDADREHERCTLPPYSDVAAEWAGAGCRRL